MELDGWMQKLCYGLLIKNIEGDKLVLRLSVDVSLSPTACYLNGNKKSGRVHTHKLSDIPEKDLSKEKMVYSKMFDVKRKLCIRWPLLAGKLQISLYKNYLTFMNNTYSDDPQYGSVKYLKS